VSGEKPLLEYYDKNNTSSGYNLIETSQLFNKNKFTHRPIIENDKCVVGVYLQIYPSCKKEEEKEE